MSAPPGWDADRAVAGLHALPWTGRAWRAHRRRYESLDATGSLLVSGRFHRAADVFPDESTWPALYLALDPETSLGEVLRHIRPERLPLLNDYRITEIGIQLTAIVDCRNLSAMSLPPDAFSHDIDYEVPQSLAVAAIRAQAEAILVRSATRLGNNLVIFPSVLRPESRLVVRSSRDPMLYVERG